ncbi:hypothetical protein ACXWRS_11675, partial [Streptococcus pyogenes]
PVCPATGLFFPMELLIPSPSSSLALVPLLFPPFLSPFPPLPSSSLFFSSSPPSFFPPPSLLLPPSSPRSLPPFFFSASP